MESEKKVLQDIKTRYIFPVTALCVFHIETNLRTMMIFFKGQMNYFVSWGTFRRVFLRLV